MNHLKSKHKHQLLNILALNTILQHFFKGIMYDPVSYDHETTYFVIM